MKGTFNTLAIFSFLVLFTGLGFSDLPLDFSGDVTLRHHRVESGTTTTTELEYQVHLNADVEINEKVRAGLTLGTNADDELSGFQTFGSNGTSDRIGLDRVFLQLDLTDRVTAIVGKFSNPLVSQSQLLFDGDLNPEGFALSYKRTHVYANVGHFILNENLTATDTTLSVAQVGFSSNTLDLGVAYIQSDELSNPEAKIVNVNGALTLLGVTAFGEYAADTKDTDENAWLVGARTSLWKLGASVSYRDTNANAVVTTIDDADFTGDKGFVYGLGYEVYDNTNLDVTYFDMDTLAGGNDNTVQVEVAVTF